MFTLQPAQDGMKTFCRVGNSFMSSFRLTPLRIEDSSISHAHANFSLDVPSRRFSAEAKFLQWRLRTSVTSWDLLQHAHTRYIALRGAHASNSEDDKRKKALYKDIAV